MLLMLQGIEKVLRLDCFNPFPRLDTHEESLDLWCYEILKNITDDKFSNFYYKKWINSENKA